MDIMEKCIRKKEKWTNKGKFAVSLLHSANYHTKLCTEFQNPMLSSS